MAGPTTSGDYRGGGSRDGAGSGYRSVGDRDYRGGGGGGSTDDRWERDRYQGGGGDRDGHRDQRAPPRRGGSGDGGGYRDRDRDEGRVERRGKRRPYGDDRDDQRGRDDRDDRRGGRGGGGGGVGGLPYQQASPRPSQRPRTGGDTKWGQNGRSGGGGGGAVNGGRGGRPPASPMSGHRRPYNPPPGGSGGGPPPQQRQYDPTVPVPEHLRRVVVLSNVHRRHSFRTIREYFHTKWNLSINHVYLEPDRGREGGGGGKGDEGRWKAYVKFQTHQDATAVAEYDGRLGPILGDEGTEAIGLHFTNVLGKNEWPGGGEDGDAAGRGRRTNPPQPPRSSAAPERSDGRPPPQQRRPPAPWQDPQQQHQQQRRRDEDERRYQLQQEEERLRRKRRAEEREEEDRRRREHDEQASKLEQKRELLARQESMVEKQLDLHKKMLSMLKDPGDKAKKMKEILSAQKRVTELKKEMHGVVSGLEELRKQQQHSSVAAAPTRSFRLDNRTTVLHVEGFPNGTDEDALRDHFHTYGPVSRITLEEDGAVKSALVHFSERGSAERAKAQGSSFHDSTLTLAWQNSAASPPAATGNVDGEEDDLAAPEQKDMGSMHNGGGEVEPVNNNDDLGINNKKGDAAVVGNEGESDPSPSPQDGDEDLMVDYDYDEDEEDEDGARWR